MSLPAVIRESARIDSFPRDAAARPQLIRAIIADHIRPMPRWKRATDVLLASIGVLILLPVYFAVSLAIVLDSRGGPIYRQTRLGHRGEPFTCWKFRSMRRDADSLRDSLMHRNEANGHIFKLKDDPRRTRVGIFLRKTSLDELPQLWNVLRGEMSLVGPRPPLPSEVVRYSDHELRRLAVVPGITGLWQVTLRGRHDFADMVALDVRYAENMSVAQDLRICCQTVWTVLRGSGSC